MGEVEAHVPTNASQSVALDLGSFEPLDECNPLIMPLAYTLAREKSARRRREKRGESICAERGTERN